jgi:hypothetical protein
MFMRKQMCRTRRLRSSNIFRRGLLLSLVLLIGGSLPSRGQVTPRTSPATVQEYPLILRQNVVAGKTPVGTKVQAKLAMATLLNGKVVPRNAVFSGEVVQSVAKTKTEPSRIAIRMDSVTWKDGSEPLNVYLSCWYYPPVSEPLGENLRYGPNQASKPTWDGVGQSPVENTNVYHPVPGNDANKTPNMPGGSEQVASNHRLSMEDVEMEHVPDIPVSLVSKRRNIKLDHYTAYVFTAAVTAGSK